MSVEEWEYGLHPKTKHIVGRGFFFADDGFHMDMGADIAPTDESYPLYYWIVVTRGITKFIGHDRKEQIAKLEAEFNIVKRQREKQILKKEAEHNAIKSQCPPPEYCKKCGESEWLLVSSSPNIRSAEWKCAYCDTTARTLATDLRDERTNRKAISKSVQREVWRRDLGKCTNCGSKENLEFDHIIPVSKGGANTTRNIQLLCEDCNRAKSDKDPGEA